MGPDLVAKGLYSDIERQIKEAMTISLITDLGDDFFTTAKERIERLKNRDNMVSSGWQVIDKKLYGGYTKGSLNIYAGGSGSGKSLFLQNQALNWAMAGMNVIYITLELSQDLVNNRLDSMLTGMSTKDIFRNSNEVCYKIERIRQEQKPGRADHEEDGRSGHDLQRHPGLPQGVPDQDRRQAGWHLHRLLGPRPSELAPRSTHQRVRQGQVCLGRDARHRHEWDIPVVSASQLNRQSVGEQEFDHSHIAGGISKINTADNVFGIFTSQSMREGGKYRLAVPEDAFVVGSRFAGGPCLRSELHAHHGPRGHGRPVR
jgi:hypothetical protein